MEKKKIFFVFMIFVSFLYSCSGELQTYDLSQEYATSLHYEGSSGGSEAGEAEEGESLVGIPARNYYGGDLKRGAIWWAGKGMTIEKGEIFTIHATEVGPDKTAFGATFPPLDLLIEEVVVKITARAEGKDGSSPVVYLQVDDANGYQTNAKRPSQIIENSENFQEYYFSLKDIFFQSEPVKHKVNGAMINSLKFFVNPGESSYTGKIFIKEIKIVPAKSIEK